MAWHGMACAVGLLYGRCITSPSVWWAYGTLSRAGCRISDGTGVQVDFLGCKAHQGFATAADAVSAEMESVLLRAVSDPLYAGYELVVTGHSLGGCTAEVILPACLLPACLPFACLPAVRDIDAAQLAPTWQLTVTTTLS